VPEHELISAQVPDEPGPYGCPVWEVQGYGTVTGAGNAPGDAAPCEVRPPWVDVRLTFSDGARLDVLAVLHNGRISIEDAQADPPLPLDGFAALAGVIEAPLHDACQVVAGRMGVGGTAADGPGPPGPEPAGGEPATGARLAAEQAPGETAGTERHAGETAGEAAASDPPGPPAERDERDEGPAGRHRAAPAPARGSVGRRVAAGVYRAAQREGRDPVLAVMSATGLSRRQSLRLIAGARDDGYLTPRHHRR
jgi:hypothetical protein